MIRKIRVAWLMMRFWLGYNLNSGTTVQLFPVSTEVGPWEPPDGAVYVGPPIAFAVHLDDARTKILGVYWRRAWVMLR